MLGSRSTAVSVGSLDRWTTLVFCCSLSLSFTHTSGSLTYSKEYIYTSTQCCTQWTSPYRVSRSGWRPMQHLIMELILSMFTFIWPHHYSVLLLQDSEEQRRKMTWVWGEETGGEQDLHVFRCPVQQDLHFPRVLFPPGYYLNTHTHTDTHIWRSADHNCLHWLSTVWGVICDPRSDVWGLLTENQSDWAVAVVAHSGTSSSYKTTSADSLNLCTMLSNTCSCSVNFILRCFYCLISVLPECVVLLL